MKIKKYNEYRNISGIKLKELRTRAKMSQKQVAEKLQLEGIDLTEKEISKIEHNNRLVHDFELFAFANIFKVSADEFNFKEIKNFCKYSKIILHILEKVVYYI